MKTITEKDMKKSIENWRRLRETYGKEIYPTLSHHFSEREKTVLNELFKNMRPFEKPDMYSKFADDVYIIEHFRFDASRNTRKGMRGVEEENKMKRRIEEKINSGQEGVIIDQARYHSTTKDFKENFEYVFSNHYKNIDGYIEHLKREGIAADDDNFHIVFLVENEFPPHYVVVENGEPYYKFELNYFETKQFYDYLQDKDRVEFILFASYIGGNPGFYFVHPRIEDLGMNLIDLDNESVQIYQKNEIDAAFVTKE